MVILCVAGLFVSANRGSRSLAYSLVSVAFQIPFSNPPAPHTEVATNANAFGRASFLVCVLQLYHARFRHLLDPANQTF